LAYLKDSLFLIYNFLKKGNDRVERINPIVGTIELINGFVKFAVMKNKTINI